ncbi:DHHC domain-containing protein [Meloidogyne graminicola]|uniref:DHHC domain-containing protein n=1 Tax=Meloidogyne graminicola TaxID=189291 RepID=A0A8S9ZYD8_9BILA|nr:DHHC domain-containing protein [Meloidogyne graminicola]
MLPQPRPITYQIDTEPTRYSISNARLYFSQRHYSLSILNYIAVLKSLHTENRLKYFEEFLDTLKAFLLREANETNTHDVLRVSTIIYGTEFKFWRTIAEHYFIQGKLSKSLANFQRALLFANGDIEWLQATTSIENLKTNLFDAWHWRMINDGKRNTNFINAINSALDSRPGLRVLDIGCGSGIFSIAAASNYVHACDLDETMCKIARSCFLQNNARVKLFEMHSNKMTVIKRYNLLISETVDCAIFGERIVDTILDAKERLLEEDAILIPNKAILLFSLIEAEAIVNENIFEHSDSIAFISDCCNVEGSASKNIKRIIPPSPYTCSYVNELKNGYRLLSTPTDGIFVDFNNVDQLMKIKNGQFIKEIILTANETGLASAVCVWFRLNLFGNIEICTSPEKNYSWQQAIYPFYPPTHVKKGDIFRFEIFIKDNALRVHPLSGLSPVSVCQILRLPRWVDMMAMNDSVVRTFYFNASARYTSVLDCTDLLIDKRFSVASEYSAIRYVSNNSTCLEKAFCKPGSVILFWPFSSQGRFLDEYLTSIIGLRLRNHKTILIPVQISVNACLINSLELCKRSRLLEDKHSTYGDIDLSPMDEYRVQYFHEIETQTFDFEQISDDVELFRMDLSNSTRDLINQLTRIKQQCIFTCSKSSVCHAILYWFTLFDPSGNSLDLRRQSVAFLPSANMVNKAKELFSFFLTEVIGTFMQLPKALTQHRHQYEEPWNEEAEDKIILSRWRLFHWVFKYLHIASLSGGGYIRLGWHPEDEADWYLLRYCHRCMGFKVPRSHHCSRCRRCVMLMDHHCPWINNCVGSRNQFHFIRFLFFVLIGAIHSSIVLTSCLYKVVTTKNTLIFILIMILNTSISSISYLMDPKSKYSQLEPFDLPITSISMFIVSVLAVGLSYGIIFAVFILIFMQLHSIWQDTTGIEEQFPDAAISAKSAKIWTEYRTNGLVQRRRRKLSYCKNGMISNENNETLKIINIFMH